MPHRAPAGPPIHRDCLRRDVEMLVVQQNHCADRIAYKAPAMEGPDMRVIENGAAGPAALVWSPDSVCQAQRRRRWSDGRLWGRGPWRGWRSSCCEEEVDASTAAQWEEKQTERRAVK